MLYNFRCRKTQEIKEYEMMLCQREQFIIDHPELEQVITKAPNTGDPVKLGFTKPPSDFMDKIDHMSRSIPGSNMKSKYWGKNIKEI